MTASDPQTLSTFRCQIRSTSVYRRGRALLAGDAVHIHSPAGGQGMNTGILDATNLAWKLALVVSGRAPDALLDSYGTERAPVAAQVLGFTQRIVRFGTQPPSLKRTVRNAVLPALRLPAVQRRLAGRMSQTLVRYPDGPLTQPSRLGGLPRPGTRVLNIDVSTADGQQTLHAVLRRCRHILLVTGEPTSRTGAVPRPDRARERAAGTAAQLGASAPGRLRRRGRQRQRHQPIFPLPGPPDTPDRHRPTRRPQRKR